LLQPQVFAGAGGKKAAEIEMDSGYKATRRTQLNDGEWAPLSCSVLFFLSAKCVDGNLGSTILGAGSVIYLWGRITMPKNVLIGPIGATLRYIGIILLAKEVYGLL
jgi:hypothetical protein